MAKKLSRRSFLECALAGGAAAGTANLTITRDAFAQASGPLIIGHHCDLTGIISSWGVWHEIDHRMHCKWGDLVEASVVRIFRHWRVRRRCPATDGRPA